MKTRAWAYLPWLFGILTLALLIGVVLDLGELRKFAVLARAARPQWLLLALGLQACTYVATAAVWYCSLAVAGEPRPLRSLVFLGLAKLFTDQALPSGGVSGTAMLARGLARRGISAQANVETVLVTIVSYYAAYLAAALGALWILWVHHQANRLLVAAAAVFSAVAIGVPIIVVWLKHLGTRSPPSWLFRVPGFAALFEEVAAAPADLLNKKLLSIQTILLQFSIFVLDALTFWVVFRALGQPIDFVITFVSFVMASVVATIGPIPLGLGTFEASSVAVLHLLGVDVEAALAATLLLRGLTFWLPMLPGIWLAGRELSEGQA